MFADQPPVEQHADAVQRLMDFQSYRRRNGTGKGKTPPIPEGAAVRGAALGSYLGERRLGHIEQAGNGNATVEIGRYGVHRHLGNFPLAVQ